MWAEGEIFVKYYSKIPSRFCWVSFDTEKLNRKHTDVFALLSFIPNKEEFSFTLAIIPTMYTKGNCKVQPPPPHDSSIELYTAADNDFVHNGSSSNNFWLISDLH